MASEPSIYREIGINRTKLHRAKKGRKVPKVAVADKSMRKVMQLFKGKANRCGVDKCTRLAVSEYKYCGTHRFLNQK